MIQELEILQQKGEFQDLVSAQLIILGIAIIGFFATGGIGKTRTALTTFRQDFELVKIKTSDIVSDIKNKNEAGKLGQEG